MKVKRDKTVHANLIEKCRQGNRKAQMKIYGLYYRNMYNTAYRILKEPAEAEDVMQQSFLDAFSNLHAFHGSGSFGSWLKRIVVNNAIDHYRKRIDTVPVEEIAIEFQYDDAGHSNETEVKETLEHVRNVMNTLPDQYRIILSLYLFEGYDHEEICQILDVSYAVSRTRYSRALSRLRQLLSNYSQTNCILN